MELQQKMFTGKLYVQVFGLIVIKYGTFQLKTLMVL